MSVSSKAEARNRYRAAAGLAAAPLLYRALKGRSPGCGVGASVVLGELGLHHRREVVRPRPSNGAYAVRGPGGVPRTAAIPRGASTLRSSPARPLFRAWTFDAQSAWALFRSKIRGRGQDPAARSARVGIDGDPSPKECLVGTPGEERDGHDGFADGEQLQSPFRGEATAFRRGGRQGRVEVEGWILREACVC